MPHAGKIEERNQRPHQRALPEDAPEREEAARHAAVRRHREHRILEIGARELGKQCEHLLPRVRIVKPQRAV